MHLRESPGRVEWRPASRFRSRPACSTTARSSELSSRKSSYSLGQRRLRVHCLGLPRLELLEGAVQLFEEAQELLVFRESRASQHPRITAAYPDCQSPASSSSEASIA